MTKTAFPADSDSEDSSSYDDSSVSDQGESAPGDEEISQQDEDSGSEYNTEASGKDEETESEGNSEPSEEEEGSIYKDDEASESDDQSGPAAQRNDFHPKALDHDFKSTKYINSSNPADQTALDKIKDKIEQYHRDHSAMPVDGDEYVDIKTLHNGNLRPTAHYRLGITMTTKEDYMRKDYKEGTERLIIYTENQWREYCLSVLESADPSACLKDLTFPVVYQFLRWYLAQRVNKNGHKKRRVKSRQSLITF